MSTRVFTGRLPDGTPVMVALFDTQDALTAEVSFKHGDGRWARWGPPTPLVEEAT